MTPELLSSKFTAGLAYEPYVQTGTPEQQRRWNDFHKLVSLTPGQRELLAGFTRQLNVLVVSGIWCGDCVQQCPFFAHIAAAQPGQINLRFVDRDQHKDLSSRLRINGGDRVPVALFLSEDFELCSILGDRTIHRYRAIARKQLGAACPTGIGGPDPDEIAHTLADWVTEFERIQLMLRISPRLRQRHND